MASDPDSADHKKKPLLAKAPPPPGAILLVIVVALMAVYFSPSIKELDETSTPEIFINRVFPEYISLNALICIRLSFGILCLCVTLNALFFSDGVDIKTVYLPRSKLKSAVLRIKGVLFLYPFTAWCWNLLGLSFFTSAYTSWKLGNGETVSPLLLKLSLLLWEMAAPFTFLVGAVVKYAIWPQAIKSHGTGGTLKTIRPLLQHNANVLMALAELVLLGGLPVHMGHVSLSLIFGLVYILFCWATMNHWNCAENGPAFLYFFMDTTLGKTTTIALFVLLGIQVFFFAVFAGVGYLSGALGHSLLAHGVFVVVMALFVCRVRD